MGRPRYDGKICGTTERLESFRVTITAIIAQPIAALAFAPLILRYLAAWRARAVVVIDADCGWLFVLIDGVEICYYCRHWASLLEENVGTPKIGPV